MMQDTIQYDVHNQKTTRVLHVEDNRVDAIILSKMLERNGRYPFAFTGVETLAAAKEKLSDEVFDIVLLDLTLPDSRGLATLESVHHNYSELPIIILTGSDDENTGIDAIRRGAQDYLIKGHLKPEIILRMIFSAIDRKKAEQALIKGHERIELATLGTSDGFWDWQVEENKMFFSARFYSLLEHNKDSLPSSSETILNLVHEEERQGFYNAIIQHLKDPNPLNMQCRLRLRSDKYRWFLIRGKAMRDETGLTYRVSGSIVDIHDQKMAEEALKQSEQRLKFALEGSSDGFLDWNFGKDELYFSPRFETMLEYSVGELTQKLATWQNIIHPDDLALTMEKLNNHLESNSSTFHATHRIKTKSGKWIWTTGRGKVVERDNQNKALRMVGAYTDITQERFSEEENLKLALRLQQASKLESIGRLAAGIAHEINTPTQFVGDNIWFLKDECSKMLPLMEEMLALIDSSTESIEYTEKLQHLKNGLQDFDLQYLATEIPMAITQSLEGVERISTIVKAMKEFSHPGSSKKELININKIIENILIVSRNEWKFNADMDTQLDAALPLIEGFQGELNQALLNMIVNAAHAINSKLPAGSSRLGTIKISTHQQMEKIIIKITDSGIGMPDEVKSRIFDPFYTTKEVGKGTGQGLAIAYNAVVERHKGNIDVDSVPNEGTTFTISLPIALTNTETIKEDEKIRTVCR